MNDYLELKELYHHGIKGQKWGVRKYQNEDGSLTSEGAARYSSTKDARKRVAIGGLKGAGLGAATGFGVTTASALVASGAVAVPLLIGSVSKSSSGAGLMIKGMNNINASDNVLSKLSKAYPYILGASVVAGVGIGIAKATKKNKEQHASK